MLERVKAKKQRETEFIDMCMGIRTGVPAYWGNVPGDDMRGVQFSWTLHIL